MENNNLLNVVVDFESGVYYAIKNNNGEVKRIYKEINGVDRSLFYKKNYSNRLIYKRRNEIIKKYSFPKSLIKNIDTVLFKTLEDYDLAYSTNYRIRYLDAIKVGNYSKRRNKHLLRDLGMSIHYDVGLLGFSKRLSFIDRIKGIKKAFQQARLLGAEVDFRIFNLFGEKNELIQNQNEGISQQVMTWKKVDEKVKEKAIIEEDKVELKKVEMTKEDNNIEKQKDIEERNSETDEKVAPIVLAKEKKEKRAIKIKNAKKEMRESKKYKNSYKLKETKKDQLDSIDIKQRKTEKYKKKHKAPVNEKAKIKESNKSEKNALVLEIDFSNTRRDGVRLVRKIDKDNEDIRDIGYKRKERKKKTLIAGFMGLAALMAVMASGKIKRNNIENTNYRSEISTEMSKPESYIRNVTIEETTEGEVVAKVAESESSVEKSNIIETSSYKKMEETKFTDNNEIKENDNKELVESDNKIDETEKIDEAEKQDYQNLVRVGAKMNIQKGKFFETPEGTGRFGRFEKYADSEKVISIIGITTKEGYKSVKSSDISLKELKEKYPDAKFSFHFEDEKGGSLGWLTSNSFEETIQNENIEIDDGLDR